MKLLYTDSFESDSGRWKLDGAGTYWFDDNRLYMDCTNPEAVGGMTLWLKLPLPGDIQITYETMAIDPADGNNLNFFLMASRLDGRDLTEADHSGQYMDYHDEFKQYIGTFTGKWSRLRKDPGFHILSENDKTVQPNQTYSYEITKKGMSIEWKVNGERFHAVTDPEPYETGMFGFRSWKTRLWVRNLQIYMLEV